MIVRVAIILLALVLAANEANATPIMYIEDTLVEGNDVNLTQGFYVCNTANPRELMADLIDTKDAVARRNLAKSRGCPFEGAMDDNAPIYKIGYVASSMCLDRGTGWQETVKGGRPVRETVVTCGREAHQFLAKRDDTEVVVIFVSLDVDYD
jgi:hypothetical protein